MEWKLVPVEPTEEMIKRGSVWAKYAEDAYKAMLAASTLPAQEDAPVAWVPVHPELGPLFGATSKHRILAEGGNNLELMPLYTRPDNNLRKAAEDLIKIWETPTGSISDLVNKINPIIENLRAVLKGK